MSFSEACLPPLTSPPTSPLTLAALPDSLKLETSLRFFGAAASIAFLTAAMNALRSNAPGSCSPMCSTCAAWAWLATSLPGGAAAPWADAAPAAAGSWVFVLVPAAFVRLCIALKFGSSFGSTRGAGSAEAPAPAGAAPAAAPPAAAAPGGAARLSGLGGRGALLRRAARCGSTRGGGARCGSTRGARGRAARCGSPLQSQRRRRPRRSPGPWRRPRRPGRRRRPLPARLRRSARLGGRGIGGGLPGATVRGGLLRVGLLGLLGDRRRDLGRQERELAQQPARPRLLPGGRRRALRGGLLSCRRGLGRLRLLGGRLGRRGGALRVRLREEVRRVPAREHAGDRGVADEALERHHAGRRRRPRQARPGPRPGRGSGRFRSHRPRVVDLAFDANGVHPGDRELVGELVLRQRLHRRRHVLGSSASRLPASITSASSPSGSGAAWRARRATAWLPSADAHSIEPGASGAGSGSGGRGVVRTDSSPCSCVKLVIVRR